MIRKLPQMNALILANWLVQRSSNGCLSGLNFYFVTVNRCFLGHAFNISLFMQ